MTRPPRIAFFSDSYHEANGVARTAGAIEACARRRGIQMLSIHAGPQTGLRQDGSVLQMDLERSTIGSFAVEHDLRFDLAMWRHARRVAGVLRWFAPDVLHFTGPSDVGQLGAYLGHRLSIPMVGSWHTNLHEYASRRLKLAWAPRGLRATVRRRAEQEALRWLMLFYKIPRVVLAPDEDLCSLLTARTGRPAFLMSRGVDTELFTPSKREVANTMVNIGYVGRLSTEKNVRWLRDVEAALEDDFDVRFTIVGYGSESAWLRRHMRRAQFPGILRGERLARAYAAMDVFAFPSETDTVGNVVLEAMASGVPVVAMDRGGPKFLAEPGRSAVIASDAESFVDGVRSLVRNRQKREAMGAAARQRALEVTSWDAIFDDICQAYRTAISLAEQRRGSDTPAPRMAASRRSA